MPVLSGYRNILNNLLQKKLNINCDLGEGFGNDELIIPFINSANIACGYHAGDATIILQTIETCIKNNVAIGAHPSFYDRENFGRKEMDLPVEDLYELIIQQLFIFKEVADIADQKINHVKPHGALYTLAAKNAMAAKAIAKAVYDFDSTLILYGLSGSHAVSEAKQIGLQTASEVFADRSYQEDGSLTPRSQPNALIDNPKVAVQQGLQMINEGTVTTVSGKTIPIIAETICVHSDGENVVALVKALHDAFKN